MMGLFRSLNNEDIRLVGKVRSSSKCALNMHR